MQERIVVTGMGTINPLGLTVEETWQNAINGVAGVGPITLFDASHLEVRIACEVKGFEPQNYMPAKEARRRDRFEQLATAAAHEAINQSGIENSDENAGRIGVVVASAIGGIGTTEEGIKVVKEKGPRRVSPMAIPMLMINGGAGMISIDHGYQGPSISVVSACASGSDAIGMGALLLKTGLLDTVIVGAAEATITEIGIATFDRVGAMSRRNHDYSQTPQPFDLNRDGLVMGEGAAILVLERESIARQRGADIFAEIAGHASTADAFHITAPIEDGSISSRAICQALDNAQVNRNEVGYINAHGTATELNDVSETRAIKNAFKDLAYNIPVSSTKSMTGHMMGATGALETIFCIQAVRHGILPPTIHFQTPDPRCDLDYLPNKAREKKIKVAVNNAFGFGGHNAVVVVREYP